MYKVMIADDHQIVLEALKMIIGSSDLYEIVGEVSNGRDLIDAAKICMPELIISDLKMPGESIVRQCQMLKREISNVKIMILTAYDDDKDISDALSEGIDGYIMKNTPPDQIQQTMEMVMLGYSCFQPKVKVRQIHSQKDESALNFTEREREDFDCIF